MNEDSENKNKRKYSQDLSEEKPGISHQVFVVCNKSECYVTVVIVV